MKITSSLILRTLSMIAVFMCSTGEAYAETYEYTYELPSLKYVHTVKLVISGEDVSGTLSSHEYGDGSKASVYFKGTISGKALTLKLAGEAELINLAAPDRNGMHAWRIGENEGEKTLFIPIDAGEEGKSIEMPLALTD